MKLLDGVLGNEIKSVKDHRLYGLYEKYIKRLLDLVEMDIFEGGLCLPTDLTMPDGAQDVIIKIVKSCFE